MAIKIAFLDIPNQRVYFDIDAGNTTERTVRQLGSLIKQEVKLAPYVDDSDIFSWSGFEDLDGGNKVGIVMKLRPGWSFWTVDAGSPHRFRITEGIVLGDSGTDPLGTPANIIWSLAEYTVSSILGAADVNDIASILNTVTTLETDILNIKRFLGIGVKRSYVGNQLQVTDESKVTVVQRFDVDDTEGPTTQTDVT